MGRKVSQLYYFGDPRTIVQLRLVATLGQARRPKLVEKTAKKTTKKRPKIVKKYQKTRKACEKCTHKSHEKNDKKTSKKRKKAPQSTPKKRFQIIRKLHQEAAGHQQIPTRISVRGPPGRETMRQKRARKAAQKWQKSSKQHAKSR